MRLVLHAGPMKTGSTYLQKRFEQGAAAFADRGIAYHTAYRRGHPTFKARVEAIASAAPTDRRTTLFLSNEVFAVRRNADWLTVLPHVTTRRAILVHRPLRETYRSLYLHMLRANSNPHTGRFDDFVAQQMTRDEAPGSSPAQTFNYAFLDAKLKAEGFDTSWVAYGAGPLGPRVCAAAFPEFPTLWEEVERAAGPQRPPRRKLSPIRSLAPALADDALAINLRFRQGALSLEERDGEIVRLLDLSETLDATELPEVFATHMTRIEAFDQRINGAFYAALPSFPV